VSNASSVTAGRVAIAVALLLLVAVYSAVPAKAARGHVFGGSFGEAGSGPGQLSNPDGIAINEATELVYVVDQSNDRVEVFTTAGTFVSEFTGASTPAKAFLNPEEIAIDNSCHAHGLTESTTPKCATFDPSDGDVYVADAGHRVVDKFTRSGEYIGQLGAEAVHAPTGELSVLDGVAVDVNGDTWIAEEHLDKNNFAIIGIDRFDNQVSNGFESFFSTYVQAGDLLLQFQEPGLAVDEQDNLYVRKTPFEFAGVFSEFSSSGAVLVPVLDSKEGPTGVATERVSNDVYIDDVEEVVRFNPSHEATERLGSGHLASGAGVAVDRDTGEVFVADQAASSVERYVLEPPGAPVLSAQSKSRITAEAATLEADINPHGALTTYEFEYGLCPVGESCVSASFTEHLPSPPAQVGAAADFEVHHVSVRAYSLIPGRRYHFRVSFSNEAGGSEHRVVGAEGSFNTQTVGQFALPDGRGWELVSPIDKHGALIEGIGQGQQTRSSADGSAFTFVATTPTSETPQGYSNLVQILGENGATGWTSQDVTPPHEGETGFDGFVGQEYKFFSEDLTGALIQPLGKFIPASSPFALSPEEASEQTPFLRRNLEGPDNAAPCAGGCFRPLVTGASGFANVPEGVSFGEEGSCPPHPVCGPVLAGATSDLSHVVVQSKTALTSRAIPGESLYEWNKNEAASGQLSLISVLPGAGEKPSPNLPRLGFEDAIARGAISSDGTRVFWSETAGASHLYVRDTAKGETLELDTVQGGDGKGDIHPIFQFATPEGNRVVFTDIQHLTPDADGGEGTNVSLYECEIVEVGGVLDCNLRDITPVLGGEAPNVQGDVLGGDEEGCGGEECDLYFVASSKRDAGAIQGSCNGAPSVTAECNLYLAHFDGHAWATTLVAVVSSEDGPDWNGGFGTSHLAQMPSRVSRDGRWLAFMSDRSLTGYDTRDAVTGQLDEEVYLYHSGPVVAGHREPGELVCASCDPTGARPVGREYRSMRYGLDGTEVWTEDRMLAASVPAWEALRNGNGEARYQPRYLSDSGRLFFNSNDGLVSKDVNGTGDVYEFEPEGVGGCSSGASSGSVVFVGKVAADELDGCIGLISSGESPEESGFLDASETGGDVFFLTAGKLLGQDVDTSLDVYDAHECTAAAPCSPPQGASPPPCDSEASCRAAPSPQPPVFGSPSSATFLGAGNVVPGPVGSAKPKVRPRTRAQKLAAALKACKRKPRRQRAVCRSRARRAFGVSSRTVRTSRGGRS
jgi:DNA-binding beta-propeller fold protein YncE